MSLNNLFAWREHAVRAQHLPGNCCHERVLDLISEVDRLTAELSIQADGSCTPFCEHDRECPNFDEGVLR